VLDLLLFASGAAGLVYEVLWARGLALTLGSTSVAQASVLASFLGGLALGSAKLGGVAERSRDPLRLFSRLELGVAACACLSIPALPLLGRLPPGSARLAASCLAVAFPAFLMGGTLPALVRWRGRGEGWERDLSWLYFVNSAGAACGALAATLLLLPRLGFELSLLAGAALSAGVGLIAPRLEAGRPAPQPAPAPAGGRVSAAPLYAAALLSGFAALSYESAWTRLLGLSLGSSTHAFALMLGAFIAGVASGGFALARGAFPALAPASLFGRLQLGACLAVLAGIPLWGALPYAFLRFGAAVPREPAWFPVYQAGQFAFCVAVMAVPAFFLGAALPLAARLDPGGGRAAAAGRVFGVNTAGNVLAAAASLKLMPLLGLRGLLLLGAAANASAGLLLLPARERARLGAAAAAAFALCAALGPWDARLLSLGAYRRAEGRPPSWAELREGLAGKTLLYYRDDRDASVGVVQEPSGRRYLKVNGKTDASDGPDMATQRLIAHLPLTLRPGAKDALVIGLGSGVTAGAALRHPIDRLDVVELIPAVTESSRFFDHASGAPLEDPRTRLHHGDARAALADTARRWDVIVSQPSNPWIAGEAGLFTREFYADARARLKPGGLMAQWFQIYEMDDETVSMVLRTFSGAFPRVTVWHCGPGDMVMLGEEADAAPDWAASSSAAARAAAQLGEFGVDGLPALLALQSQSDGLARELAGRGRVHEDRFPWLEFLAPRAFFLDRSSGLLRWADEMRRLGPGSPLLLARYVKERRRPLSAAEKASISRLRRGLGLYPAAGVP
jgi:spermidine synthase